jgi:tetratricopeptide (TPR) repeat protein
VLALANLIDVWLGLSKDPQETLKQSLELYRKAVTLDNSFAIGYVGLGYTLMMMRQYDEAIAQAERGLELEPNSADVVFGYAFVLVYAGGDSIPFFERAMRLNPKPPNLYLRIYAEALRDAGRYEEAIVQLEKAIEREPGDIFSHIFLTAAYSMKGHDKEARAAAAEVFKINPKFSLE